MALYDSSDLARRIKLRLRRPTTDYAFTVSTTDDVLYDVLTEAQDRLTTLLGTHVPSNLWTVPTKLTSSDSGYTYGFGTDTDGVAILAFGHFVLYPNQESIPDNPLVPGVDYLIEGAVLRMPNNAPVTWTDGPYCQYVAPSNVITSSTQPTVPKFARKALLSDATRRAARFLELDEQPYEDDFQSDWAEVLAALRTQANGQNRPITITRNARTSRWRYQRGF